MNSLAPYVPLVQRDQPLSAKGVACETNVPSRVYLCTHSDLALQRLDAKQNSAATLKTS